MARQRILRYARGLKDHTEALSGMRLEKIKLAGFKSFVDPTVLEFRSPLVAVVGPNGCGKSNIIDAIRWVMGESSAKNLRGESMSDVIFNGSSTRKPVGQASIELVFDNSDGSLGGEYARYNEISVRRVGTRDGQSSYFFNGTKCRRKDITDIFLGTGLGPRSYAIIEQGMISRVIEAKPEELRGFLEEAAGISLYRKRRHETELRMRHTRENLERLNDVRQELEKQLERLKRQSESAERYQVLKKELDQFDLELAALRWQAFHQQLEEKASSIRKLSTELEEKLSVRASLDLALEKEREQHVVKMDVWKKEQSQFYDLGTQVARVEQTLQHHRERVNALETDRTRAEESYKHVTVQAVEDEARLLSLKEASTELQPESDSATLALKQAEGLRQEAEEAMRHWNQQFETFQQNAEKPQRAAEVEKARIEQLERQSKEAMQRFERLQAERAEIDTEPLEQELSELEKTLLARENEAHQALSALNDISAKLTKEREALKLDSERLDDLRGQLQSYKGRFASLEALQQAALGKTDSFAKKWLENNGLQQHPRLAEILAVEQGFECAVETVLGSSLEAVCVPGIDPVTALLSSLTEGNLTFVENSASSLAVDSSFDRLSSKVKANFSVEGLLADVYVVNDLVDALQKRKFLKPQESIVTRDGLWLGTNWLRVNRGSEGHTGILAREAALKETQQSISDLNQNIQTVSLSYSEQQAAIQAGETKREALQQAQQQHAKLLNEVTAKISALRTRLEHHRNRLSRLALDNTEQKQKMGLAEEEIALARLTLQNALDEMEAYTKKRVLLQEERENLRELLQKVNAETVAAREKSHALALKAQSVFTQCRAVEEGLQRLSRQCQDILERKTSLAAQLENVQQPMAEMQESLTALLSQRALAEETVNRTRIALEELEENLRTCEKQRHATEEAAQVIRTHLEQTRLDWQAIEVRAQTVLEKFSEKEQSVEQVLLLLPPDASEEAWQAELQQITRRIERLGMINLAAIEEYKAEAERKHYLDSQHQDLTEALDTLEAAIRKIDKETKVRFSETFDKVNTEFQALFPRLFGGGQAYLELIGDDLLEAGVSVMARPPGKRNSSIHLLSGGEKALTAVSLVFAIFQLNPAPFCLLDEVDAPLDDANVGRFCELVKELSKTVQLIFVTHNKVAMEIAHHLVGVTMKEPGVSRLVSVNVEEAAALMTE
jgi:chromosome segregation protein